MNKIIIFSAHCYHEQRQAGFHHIANTLVELGHDILFYTTPVSRLFYLNTWLKGNTDHRIAALKTTPPNQLQQVSPLLQTYIQYNWVHPVKTFEWIENILDACYQEVKLPASIHSFIQTADVAIFESCLGIYHIEQVKHLNPNIKLVYRVSDDLELLKTPKKLQKFEQKFAQKCHLISTPTQSLLHKFRHFSHAKLCLHGINKVIFDQSLTNPYKDTNLKHAVFVGTRILDTQFLSYMSAAFPQIMFHIIGPIPISIHGKNIKYYGELPFIQAVPFIKFANIGMMAIKVTNGEKDNVAKDALKVIQYTYCGLAIVAPETLKTTRVNTFYYQPDHKQSMIRALNQALEYNKSKYQEELKQSVNSWVDVSTHLLND